MGFQEVIITQQETGAALSSISTTTEFFFFGYKKKNQNKKRVMGNRNTIPNEIHSMECMLNKLTVNYYNKIFR